MENNTLVPLSPHDLRWCLRRMPKAVQTVLKTNARKSCVAGGFIRSCVAGETINDVDIFADCVATAKAMAFDLSVDGRPDGRPRKVHESDNALTVKDYFVTPQIIHRW